MSELRDRIAVALASEKWVNLLGNAYDMDDLRALADAVIEALDLRIEDKCKTASGQKQLFGVSGFWEVDGD